MLAVRVGIVKCWLGRKYEGGLSIWRFRGEAFVGLFQFFFCYWFGGFRRIGLGVDESVCQSCIVGGEIPGDIVLFTR